ncbi:hypothetical protein Ddc_09514 [Ditylenchus destructor]|nr:hypothetical protein Ddc_09514 [Ditylenchus destructor]
MQLPSVIQRHLKVSKFFRGNGSNIVNVYGHFYGVSQRPITVRISLPSRCWMNADQFVQPSHEHSKAPARYLFSRDGSEYAGLANCCSRLCLRPLFPDLLCGYLYSTLHGRYWGRSISSDKMTRLSLL